MNLATSNKMAGKTCCSGRRILIGICVVQLVATLERQVFDFLGYMWMPIVANFFQIMLVIFGLFGTFQYRPKYLVTYVVWSVLYIGWNVLVICLYLEVGNLSIANNSAILNLGTSSRSWWYDNGIACDSGNGTAMQAHVATTSSVSGCLLGYEYVETLHAALQILFSVLGFIFGCYVIHVFNEEDDSFAFVGGFDPLSAYSPPTKTSHMQLQPITY
ncbi:PREDICTED: sodium/potassium-transporting ATPase subunit beta-1-interacting protein 1-like [Priapulus caudatus]|uniref:Sodium/potassium-transporting ATPase subunit beta-1-interacting protein n=1 Tax=Priapulus caudatus TaxID=37621 RepID=A0ABM1DXU5_PRICU|nr:PREDICTED: sodium/potassium-transporting ATPase subunit beta-1-interacting protein 1-like [Priapulus caudatus]